jgi:hypothetical protein
MLFPVIALMLGTAALIYCVISENPSRAMKALGPALIVAGLILWAVL